MGFTGLSHNLEKGRDNGGIGRNALAYFLRGMIEAEKADKTRRVRCDNCGEDASESYILCPKCESEWNSD